MTTDKTKYVIDTTDLEKRWAGVEWYEEWWYKRKYLSVRQVMSLYKGILKQTEFSNSKIELYPIKGGGWIENERNLSQSGKCWIEKGAIVCQDATVSGDAVIESGVHVGNAAKVAGSAKVEGNSVIGGYAYVRGHVKDSTIGGRSKIMDGAEVKGSKVVGDANVFGVVEKSTVGGTSTIYGEVKDGSIVVGKSSIIEGSSVEGPYILSGVRVMGKIGKIEDEDEEDGEE